VSVSNDARNVTVCEVSRGQCKESEELQCTEQTDQTSLRGVKSQRLHHPSSHGPRSTTAQVRGSRRETFPMFGVGVVNRDAIIDIPEVAIDGTCALAPKLTCDKKNFNFVEARSCSVCTYGCIDVSTLGSSHRIAFKRSVSIGML
jgi:hypothetical protein